MASTSEKKSNTGTIIAAILGTVIYAVSTYVVVHVAGGTDVEPGYSNTPNGVTPGAPPFDQ